MVRWIGWLIRFIGVLQGNQDSAGLYLWARVRVVGDRSYLGRRCHDLIDRGGELG